MNDHYKQQLSLLLISPNYITSQHLFSPTIPYILDIHSIPSLATNTPKTPTVIILLLSPIVTNLKIVSDSQIQCLHHITLHGLLLLA